MKLNQMETINIIIETTEGMLPRLNNVGWQRKGHENDFINYLLTIAFINSLEPGTKRLGGDELSEYEVFTPFKGLIIPSKVTVDGSDTGANLINTAVYELNVEELNAKGYKILSAEAFKKFGYTLCACFSKDKSQYMMPITELRKEVVLADVINRGVCSGLVAQHACYPLHLKVAGYENYAYQHKEIKALERQLDNVLKEL